MKRGEIFGFLGPNGAGKTTTERMLCGLLTPTYGTIQIAGYDMVNQAGAAKTHLGYMPQKFSLYDDLKIWENLEFFSAKPKKPPRSPNSPARPQPSRATIARGLRPVEISEEGLMDALRELAANTQNLFGIPCEFRCDTPAPVRDNDVATQLYYIAQEAVNNAVKHSGAKNIVVSLNRARR